MPIVLDRLPRWRLMLACLCTGGFLALSAGPALADSISPSIAPAPVKSVTSEVSWSAESEEGRFDVVYVNNPGVPCAADP